MLEIILIGLALIAIVLGVIAWSIYMYPSHTIISLLEFINPGKKEWWQDRVKRIEKEDELLKAKKAKKG